MARERPLQRLVSIVVERSHRICLLLIVAAVLGLLALPLLDRPIRFEEKGLLAGVAYATLGNAGSALFQDAARIARVAASAGHFQRPGAAAALASELRAAGLASTQLTRPTVFPPGAPPCRCANVHTLIRSRRGDGLEALAVVTPVAFALQRPDPAYDGRNQSAAAAELALMTGAALALHLAGGGSSGGGGGGGGGGAGRWLARDVIWVMPDMSCGTEGCLAAWVDHYYERRKRGWRPQGAAAAAAGQAPAALPPLLRGGVIQQAVVLEALAGPGEYDTAELLVAGREGLLPKLDMFQLLRHLLGYTISPALWRDDRVAPGAPTLAGRLHSVLLAAVEALSPTHAARSYVQRLMTGLQFAWQQAVGLPAGPHAAFKEYMVDAATVRLVQRAPPRPGGAGARRPDPAAHALSLGSCLELLLRSLNNLVERVHHSPFLYVLTGVESFVSVERYVGPAAALALVLQLQAAWSARCVPRLLVAAASAGGTPSNSGDGAASTWAAAAARAAARTAALAVAAVLLQDAACGPALLGASPAGGFTAAAAGPPWAGAVAAARSLLARPLQEPAGAAAAAVLLGSVAGAAAVAAQLAGRWAAAARGATPRERAARGNGGTEGSAANGGGAAAGRPAQEAQRDAGGRVVRRDASAEPPQELKDRQRRRRRLRRAAAWHAERTVVLTATAVALTPLVCLNWAAALVAGAYMAPLVVMQGWAASGLYDADGVGSGFRALVWKALGLAAWLAVAPPVVLCAAAVVSTGAPLGFSASDGLCRLSHSTFWFSYVVALSLWLFGLSGA